MSKVHKQFMFLSTCGIVLLGLVMLYSIFGIHFSQRPDLILKVHQLEDQISRERFAASLVYYQLKDYQQSVALLLPNEKEIQNQSLALRGLASVTRQQSGAQELDLSSVIFVRGKEHFNLRQYESAIVDFTQLLENYPLSVYSVDSYFFIVECYFLLKSYKQALVQIDQMVHLFPDHDLTGFALLRMGQISETHHQVTEALEIYKTVALNFKNSELRAQATKMADGVEYR